MEDTDPSQRPQPNGNIRCLMGAARTIRGRRVPRPNYLTTLGKPLTVEQIC